MGLMILVVTLCSIADPTSCSDRRVVLEQSGSTRECTAWAQTFLAQWMDGHPGMSIRRWSCETPEQEEDAI